MFPLTKNSQVFKYALVLYLDHARERIEKLCCQWHTFSGSIFHIVVSQTSDKYSVCSRYQFTFTPHVRVRTTLFYVIMTSFRTSNEGPISTKYTGSNLLHCGKQL